MRSMQVCNHNMVDGICGVCKIKNSQIKKTVCNCVLKMNTLLYHELYIDIRIPVRSRTKLNFYHCYQKYSLSSFRPKTHNNVKKQLYSHLSISALHAQKYLLSLSFSAVHPKKYFLSLSFSALHSPQRELDGSTGLSGSHLAFCLHLSGFN